MMTGTASVNSLLFFYQLATIFVVALLALYDIRHHKVKNKALAYFLPWCLLSLPVSAYATPMPFALLFLRAFLGFLCGGLLLLSASCITHGGIGGGDIKLAALLGIIYGAGGICFLLLAASAAALLFTGLQMILPGGRKKQIPFVPFLCAGLILFL